VRRFFKPSPREFCEFSNLGTVATFASPHRAGPFLNSSFHKNRIEKDKKMRKKDQQKKENIQFLAKKVRVPFFGVVFIL